MEKVVNFYLRAKKLVAAIAAGVAPIGVALEQIFADGQIAGDDAPYIVATLSTILGWFGVYYAANKVGAVTRKR